MDNEFLSDFKRSLDKAGHLPCETWYLISCLDFFNTNEGTNVSIEELLDGLSQYLVEDPPGVWDYLPGQQPRRGPKVYLMPEGGIQRGTTKKNSDGVSIEFD